MSIMSVNKIFCDQTENLVAYIYDEMDTAARFSFEKHIAECSNCDRESRELTLASGMVKQWRMSEFDSLQTPQTDLDQILNDPQPLVASESVWFERLLAIFRLPRIATVGFAFGALTISTAIFAFFIISFDHTSEISELDLPTISNVNNFDHRLTEPKSEKLEQNDISVDSGKILPVQKNSGSDNIQDTFSAPKAFRVNATRNIKSKPLKAKSQNVAINEKAPRLTQYEEYSDDSLRLSDLMDDFDEVGSS